MRETSRVTGTCSGATAYRCPPKSKPSSGSASSKRRPSPERSRSRPRSKVSERPAMHLTVPAGRGRSGGLFLLLFGDQLALEDLAGLVARQLVDEHELLGHLVVREVGLHVLLELGLVGLARPARHHEGLQRLAELLVLDADDRHLGDAVVPGQQVLDLRGEDVLAARDDHLVVAAVDEQAPAVVELADVAAGHEALDDLLAAAARISLELHLV